MTHDQLEVRIVDGVCSDEGCVYIYRGDHPVAGPYRTVVEAMRVMERLLSSTVKTAN